MKEQNNINLLIKEAQEIDLLNIDINYMNNNSQFFEAIKELQELGFISNDSLTSSNKDLVCSGCDCSGCDCCS